MDAFCLLLIGLLFWPVIRSFAELVLAIRHRKPGKTAPIVDSFGWLALTLICLVGAATCMEAREPFAAVAFTTLSIARIAQPRLSAATTLTRAKLAAIQKD